MSELDVHQHEALNFCFGPCRVIAGAGSGKTSVLTGRIVRLIQSGEKQSSILAVTFSKAAATEMHTRVAKKLGVPPAQVKSRICTIHSLGYNIFMRHKAAVGYKGPHVVSGGRCDGLLRKLLNLRGKPYCGVPYATARAYINAAKRNDLAPEDLMRKPDADKRIAQLYEDFEREKRNVGLLNFDDMIFLAWRILRDHVNVRTQYQQDFKWVLNDEFHDSSPLEFKLVSCIAEPEQNLWVVYDQYQAIYGFKGADPEICRNFDKYYPDCKTIHLGINYRSRPAIVQLYKETIAQHADPDTDFIESIRPAREQGDRGDPVFQRFMFDFQESDYVAARIVEIRAREKDSTIAVLYRTNKQSRAVEESLRVMAITYVVRGSSSFFRLREIAGAIAFLKFVETPDDNKVVEELILSPCKATYGLGKAAVDVLNKCGGKFWLGALESCFDGTRFQRPAENANRRLYDILQRCRYDYEDVAELSVEKQLQIIYDVAGLIRDDLDNGPDSVADNLPAENLKELLKAARPFKSRKEFLDYVGSFTGESKEINAVQLMSIHRCVHPDTFVEVASGVQRIRDIADAGVIATPFGMEKYTNKVKRPSEKALEITTKSGYSLTVSSDHGMTSWDGHGDIRKEARLLKKGDWLRLKIGATATVVDPLPIDFHILQQDVRATIHQLPKVLNEKVAEFLGLMVADGTIFKSGFRVVKKYESVVDSFCSLALGLFGVHAKKFMHGNAHAAEVDSVMLSAWLLNFDGVSPNNKDVPSAILRSSPLVQCAFLRGLFEDGTVNIKGDLIDHVHWDNRSFSCVKTVQYMLLRLGIISSIKWHHSGKHGIGTLYIYSDSLRIFASKIGFIAKEKNQKLLLPTYGSERQLSIPVSKEEIYSIRDSLTLFERQNGCLRGLWSRGTARKVIGRTLPCRHEFLKERLAWHYVKIAAIKEVEAETMCVEVPSSGRFLQNGFDGWNSKGLEFDFVFLVGTDQDTLPHKFATDQDEELRLAYVGVSRAREEIYILSHDRPSEFFSRWPVKAMTEAISESR